MTFQKSALATACALAGMMIVSTPAMAIGGASGPHVGYPRPARSAPSISTRTASLR